LQPDLPDFVPLDTESFFRFRRMWVRRDVNLAHFQLRNTLACADRGRAFYAGNGVVSHLNPLTGAHKVAMAFNDTPGAQITTLAAGHGLLVAGGFNGEYCLRNLDAEFVGEKVRPSEGVITHNVSGITNHVQIHLPRRSNSPHASFASNDTGFRTLDLQSETFVCETSFPYAINCSAVSPDRRLRVMVGDLESVLICAAEKERNTGGKPDVLLHLNGPEGHRDFGFACDWADDGVTVATGFQDKSVKVWDARMWTNSNGLARPVHTIRCEMAGARSVKFSPLGSGKRVLVAAEEADYVSIIDAETFRTKQTFDIFGEIGGVDFAEQGNQLAVLCCDRKRGGVLLFDRCGAAMESGALINEERYQTGYAPNSHWKGPRGWDWDTSGIVQPPPRRDMARAMRRRVRQAATKDMPVF
jgi:hypothetical protein